MTARRLAWELAHGSLADGVVVNACPDDPACVRVEHLSVHGAPDEAAVPRRRSPRGGGSKTEVRPGVWKLTVSAGRYDDVRVRRVHRTVHASTEAAATRALAAFVTEVQSEPLPGSRRDRDITIDDAIGQFLTEHLLGEKGREPRTVDDYRRLHRRWFAPDLGHRRVRDIDEAAIDRVFGRMQEPA